MTYTVPGYLQVHGQSICNVEAEYYKITYIWNTDIITSTKEHILVPIWGLPYSLGHRKAVPLIISVIQVFAVK